MIRFKLIIILMLFLSLNCSRKSTTANKIEFSENEKYLGVTKWKNTIKPPSYKIKIGKYQLSNEHICRFKIPNYLKDSLSTELKMFDDFYKDSNQSTKSLKLDINVNLISHSYESEDIFLNSIQKEEYYQIDFEGSKVKLEAYTVQGLSIGMATLYYELFYGSGSPPKFIKDWPDIRHRYLQIELKAMDPDVVLHNLERAWIGHFNGLLFCMHNSVSFKSIQPYVERWAMTPHDFEQIVDYSRKLKFKVIPQFSFISHQKKEFVDIDISPELMHNELTLNPANDSIYHIIFPLIDEVDSLIHPEAIHIGHDEVLGYLEKHRRIYGEQLPAKLFLKNVITIHKYLKSKGIQTWMWGDMLLNPNTYTDMHSSSLNATKEYEALLKDIPKDIVICDWHYWQTKWRLLKPLTFPSIHHFRRNGNKVIGATFKHEEVTAQFALAIYKQIPNRETAMIATVWHEMLNGSIKQIEKSDSLNTFDFIVQSSAESFWNIQN